MNRSIGGFILYIATALYLLAGGVGGLFFKTGAVYGMAGGLFGGVAAIVFSLAALVAGILLLLQLFGMEFGLIEPILIGFAILWLIFIIVADFVGGIGTGNAFWAWLATLASHLIVLGAIASGTSMFGGN